MKYLYNCFFMQEFTEREELLELVALQWKKTFHCNFLMFC